MRRMNLLFVLPLLLSLEAGAAGLPISFVEDFEGNRIALYIDPAELAAAPVWKIGEAPIPLGVDQVVSLMKAWAKERHPEYDDLEIKEIALKSIRARDGRRYWHYLVQYDGISKGFVIHRPHQFCAVLLDGKVIPAVVEIRP